MNITKTFSFENIHSFIAARVERIKMQKNAATLRKSLHGLKKAGYMPRLERSY